jgi:DNA mismatch repair protein MutS2
MRDSLERAQKGATLTCSELVAGANLLRSARVCFRAVQSLADDEIPNMKELTLRLVFDERLEGDIGDKIVGENELSDHASEKLFSIRREIRLLNERIRTRLSDYLTGDERQYLQDGIVTVRGDRYVLPVKAEYKRSVRGFIHDRSATGATVFIEPEEVLEMNNELRSLKLDEQEEIERILSELSHALGAKRDALEEDIDILSEIDGYHARAEYGYRLKCVKPVLNDKGRIEIVKGRHPLLDQKTAVPVSLSLGEKYSFLLVSGANTGGKTVSLKMCGLFCLMAMCGMFVPAAEGTRLSVFDGVYCDVGDSQSIEENLSTFSAHIQRLKEILEHATARSLVLIDELGGGTDPEEGQALARAVIATLMKKGCRGIVTTHYSALKEYAYETDGIENASMEFDAATLRPLYRMKTGTPGSSNALAICTKLGFPKEIVEEARKNLSDGARSFEKTIRAAEESRIAAEETRKEAETLKGEWHARLSSLEKEEEAFKKERERFLLSSKAEARRIVNERTAQAEEILSQIEELFQKESLSQADLIAARTLKNRLANSAYGQEEEEKVRLAPVDIASLKAGDKVFLQSMNAEGVVLSVRKDKGVAEVQCGGIRVRSKQGDLYELPVTSPKVQPKQKKERVQVVKNLSPARLPTAECNVIGKTVAEALPEVEAFLDGAVLSGLATVRIVHGMGTGKLRAGILK